MKPKNSAKQLVKKALTNAAVISLLFNPALVFAADLSIDNNSTRTTQVILDGTTNYNNLNLGTTTGNGALDNSSDTTQSPLLVTGSGFLGSPSNGAVVLGVSDGSTKGSIFATGGVSAVNFSGTFNSFVLHTGSSITSDASGSGNATVVLGGTLVDNQTNTGSTYNPAASNKTFYNGYYNANTSSYEAASITHTGSAPDSAAILINGTTQIVNPVPHTFVSSISGTFTLQNGVGSTISSQKSAAIEIGGNTAYRNINISNANGGTISGGTGKEAITVLGGSGSSTYVTINNGSLIFGSGVSNISGNIDLRNAAGGNVSNGSNDIITGNILFGTQNFYTSALTNSGTINGNITLGGGASSVVQDNILTINGGSINGDINHTIDGHGKVVISSSTYTLGGNIGNLVKIGSVVLDDSIFSPVLTVGDKTISANSIIIGSTSNSSSEMIVGSNSVITNSTISGQGTLEISDNHTLGSGTSINSSGLNVNIFAGKTLDANTNNNAITAEDITLNSSTSQLTLGTGSFNAKILAAHDGDGIVNFNGANFLSLAQDIGTSSNKVGAVNIGSGATLYVASDKNVYANGITLKGTGAIEVESLALGAAVTNDGNGNGNVILNVSDTLTADFGNSSQKFGAVTIGETQTLTTNGKVINANSINLGSGSTISFGNETLVTTSIDGTNTNLGTVNFTGDRTIASGTLIGSTNGIGALNISGTTAIIANESINAATVTVGDGTNSASLAMESGKNITGAAVINDNATLSLGGTISGAIIAAADGKGTVNFNAASTTLAADVGDSTNKIGTINVADGTTLSTGTGKVYAANLELLGANGATLNIDNSNFSAAITTATNGKSTVNFNANNTLAADVGDSTNKIGTINVADGTTLDTSTSKVYANNIELLGSTNGGGTIFLDNDNFVGAITTETDGKGEVDLNASTTKTLAGDIGTSTKKIGHISIGAIGGTIINTGTSKIYANNIELNGSGVNSVTLNIDNGNFGGTITAVNANNNNTINFKDNTTLAGDIGTISKRIANINVAANKTVDAAANNIYSKNFVVNGQLKLGSGSLNVVNSTTVASGGALTFGTGIITSAISNQGGTINFGDSANIMTGNIASNNLGGTFNAGKSQHIITGTFGNVATTGGATNNIQTEIASSSQAGLIESTGAATIVAGTKLKVTLPTSVTLTGTLTYDIVKGGTGTSIQKITDADINATDGVNSGSNKLGAYTFTTSVSNDGKELILTVVKASNPTLPTTNITTQQTFNAVSNIENPTGTLFVIKNFITNDTNNLADREEAIKSLTPQTDNSTNKNSFAVATASLDVAGQRLSNIRTGVASGDNKVSKGMWAQAFGGNAAQTSNATADGYRAKTNGFAVGMDSEALDDSRLGLSVSQANSVVNGKSGGKRNNITSYQFNLYGSSNFKDHYFMDGLAGVSFNRYSSNRTIALVNSVASANYSGQTYIAKIEGGKINDLGDGFTITPKATITAAHNQVSNYTEGGADSANLHVKTKSANFFETRVGSSFDYNFLTTAKTRINPNVSLSYGYDFIGAKQNSTSNFVGQNTTFNSQGTNVYKGSIKLGAGLNIYRINAVSVNLDYGLEKKTNYVAHSASARLRYDF